jgi:serine/threonine protein kinase
VASNGVVKVSDFGSATIVERNSVVGSEQRTVGESVGTPQWMAPEVWASDVSGQQQQE